jgi:hypothetical protein
MSTNQRNEIESLLEELESARQRIYLAQAHGVQPAGLRDLKSELRSLHRRLQGDVAHIH